MDIGESVEQPGRCGRTACLSEKVPLPGECSGPGGVERRGHFLHMERGMLRGRGERPAGEGFRLFPERLLAGSGEHDRKTA